MYAEAEVEDVRYKQVETACSCFECGMPSSCAHHVIPKSRGGVRTVELCGFCHAKAHHRNGNMDSRVLTKQALDTRRKNGQRIGQIPYGYELVANGLLIEVPAEMEAIKKMHQLRDAGMSLRAIASVLDSESIPTKKGIGTKCTKPNSQGKVRQPRSGLWSHHVVRLIIARKGWSTGSVAAILKRTQKRPSSKQLRTEDGRWNNY
jgi:hypothetical protein